MHGPNKAKEREGADTNIGPARLASAQFCSRPETLPLPLALLDVSSAFSLPNQRKSLENMVAIVQKPAPTFKATAVVDGLFKDISLADYLGQWYVLRHLV